jgi:hypothetical protein
MGKLTNLDESTDSAGLARIAAVAELVMFSAR